MGLGPVLLETLKDGHLLEMHPQFSRVSLERLKGKLGVCFLSGRDVSDCSLLVRVGRKSCFKRQSFGGTWKCCLHTWKAKTERSGRSPRAARTA